MRFGLPPLAAGKLSAEELSQPCDYHFAERLGVKRECWLGSRTLGGEGCWAASRRMRGLRRGAGHAWLRPRSAASHQLALRPALPTLQWAASLWWRWCLPPPTR